MRTGTITIDGKFHLLCFSVRVVRSCTERYGSMRGLYEALSVQNEVQRLDETVWTLAEMMRAGDRYARVHQLDNEPPLSEDALFDCCDFDDLANMRAAIVATINNGRQTHVEADYPNAAATQGES